MVRLRRPRGQPMLSMEGTVATTGHGSSARRPATLAYPSQSVEVQKNRTDSHETVRVLTNVGGNANRVMLAALFQMTWAGAPTIRYGDEIDMGMAATPTAAGRSCGATPRTRYKPPSAARTRSSVGCANSRRPAHRGSPHARVARHGVRLLAQRRRRGLLRRAERGQGLGAGRARFPGVRAPHGEGRAHRDGGRAGRPVGHDVRAGQHRSGSPPDANDVAARRQVRGGSEDPIRRER